MGNGREVRQDLVKKETKIFLGESVLPGEHKPKVYSLDEEFRKTKKNRHWKIYIIFSVFILGITGITLFVSYSIQQRNKMLIFAIGDFQDINLSELLGSAKKLEKQMQSAKDELSAMEVQLQYDISKVQEQISKEIEIMLTQQMTQDQKTKLIAEKRGREIREIRRLQLEYAKKSQSKKNEIAVLQKDIDAYDQRTMAQARKSEEVISNYQRIHEIQMQEQKKYYDKRIEQIEDQSKNEVRKLKSLQEKYVDALILRYNPIFDSQQIKEILEKKLDFEESPVFRETRPELWSDEELLSYEEFEKIKLQWTSYSILMKKMLEIPYLNSVKPALTRMDEITRFLLKEYETLLDRFGQALSAKILVKNSFDNALEYYASQVEKEDGYVVDARDTGQVLVILHPRYQIEDKTQALIFRGNKEYIGKLSLTRQKDQISGVVLELKPGKKLQPFDKILLILSQERD